MDSKELYEKFDWDSLKEEHLKSKIVKILEAIPPNVSGIIDIGCGNGAITNAIGKIYDVTGVDRSESALKFVKTKKIQASSDSIPVDDHSFDMVASFFDMVNVVISPKKPFWLFVILEKK